MRQRRTFKQSLESDEGLINLTPLIDVVFVVLIMFIIVAPMLEIDRIELAKSVEKNTKEMAVIQESSPITLRVRADNTLWLNSKQITEEELLTLLKMARQQNPNRIPQLFHDKKAFFGTYQTVKNCLESAGFEQLDIILEPG